MNYVPLVPGITVSGSTLDVFIQALGSFTVLREAMLEVLGVPEIGVDQWYSQEQVLRAYQKVGYVLGGRGLERFGQIISTTAFLPPGIEDAHTVLSQLDVVYHLHHRRDGVVMLDLATGQMLEGIGHYYYERAGERAAMMTCDNPYPCRLEIGLLRGFASRFQPGVSIEHEPGECRDRDGSRCVYRVHW
jgi:hypothetical protein